MRDIECALIERWHWNLFDLDNTEMESVLGFINHYPRWKRGSLPNAPQKDQSTYADEATWL